ncbi:cilia- and flagella-associated protein HOATZ isoform X8 [Oncorhynchus keta]|uniref:cilia- and flagella-associated protein HOATZ isoform X8 n=1 Tax=Oncorhynchus keta TaxID=8018 RepID=UPI00227B2D26|nr:cilia- and flagella-associated protein HOATZ isoform X8 [Oncorhynchus keta]
MFESEPRAGVTEEEERREAEQLETELDKYFFTVFDGSSPEDVSHAKQLWTSLSLLPPLESRLVNADIRQRLPIARTNQETLLVVDTNAALKPSSSDHSQTERGHHQHATSTETEEDPGWLLTPQGTWTQTWRRSEGFSNTQTSASEQNQADPCLQELMF